MGYTDTIKRVLREYHNRITELEDKKFDIEYIVKKKDFEVLFERATVARTFTRRRIITRHSHDTVTILNVVALV